MNRIHVDSSNISEIGFDKNSLTLEVLFVNGRLYQYFDVPENVHQDLVSAGSVGQYFNAHVRGVYRYARV